VPALSNNSNSNSDGNTSSTVAYREARTAHVGPCEQAGACSVRGRAPEVEAVLSSTAGHGEHGRRGLTVLRHLDPAVLVALVPSHLERILLQRIRTAVGDINLQRIQWPSVTTIASGLLCARW